MEEKENDSLLIERILSGDKPAFGRLILRYQNMVFTLALRIVGRREDAEEVAQDVFLKVYNNLAGFNGNAKFSSWLYRIAYNTALTKIRNVNYNTKFAPAEDKQTVSNDAEKTFKKEYVNHAVSRLNAEDATIITLFYLSEKNLDEIAEVLQIDANAAKVRLHRARKKLREKMEMNEIYR